MQRPRPDLRSTSVVPDIMPKLLSEDLLPPHSIGYEQRGAGVCGTVVGYNARVPSQRVLGGLLVSWLAVAERGNNRIPIFETV